MAVGRDFREQKREGNEKLYGYGFARSCAATGATCLSSRICRSYNYFLCRVWYVC